MNDTSGSSIEELQHQVRSLNTFFLATLAVLVFLSFALNVFIFRQVSETSKQSALTQKFVADYEAESVPKITEFINKLTAASKTNAEVARLLTKYNIPQEVAKPRTTSLSPPSAATPGTLPAAAPKK